MSVVLTDSAIEATNSNLFVNPCADIQNALIGCWKTKSINRRVSWSTDLRMAKEPNCYYPQLYGANDSYLGNNKAASENFE